MQLLFYHSIFKRSYENVKPLMVCHFLHMKIVIEYSLVLEGIALCLNSSDNTKAQ